MTVLIHWRRRHITAERLDALRAVLDEHPGDTEVVVAVTGTGQRFRLPVKVNPVDKLRRQIGKATGACAVFPCENAF